MQTNMNPMDLSRRTVTGYTVYTHGRTENHGDTKTLAGARSKARALAKLGWTAQIVAFCTDGIWTWIETI